MSRLARRWLFFCLVVRGVLLQNTTADSTTRIDPAQNSSVSSDSCELDRSLYNEAAYYFAISSNCQLLINLIRPLEAAEIYEADLVATNSSVDCDVQLPSAFPVASNELGVVFRKGDDLYGYIVVKTGDAGNTTVHDLSTMPNIEMHLSEGSPNRRKSCHLDRKKMTIRCLKVADENGQTLVKIVDFDGDDQNSIRVFEEKVWPLPGAVNVKNAELLLSYYDEFTESNRIWMEHSLQWFYNVNLDEQEKRGNKTTRLTTYHLANRKANREFVVPVYADSSGMVTAHCEEGNYTQCRYSYNRVDAKSAMDGTCILELSYLAIVGIFIPSRHVVVDSANGPSEPLALVQERSTNKPQPTAGGFIPIYILVAATFLLVVTMMVVHFFPSGTEDLIAFHRKIEDDIRNWNRDFMIWAERRAEARAEMEKKEEEAAVAAAVAAAAKAVLRKEDSLKKPPLPSILKGSTPLAATPKTPRETAAVLRS